MTYKSLIKYLFLLVSLVWVESEELMAKTGQPVPRFVSLRSDRVNVRVGPGKRYPLEWVFTRARMPVEVVAEFDAWRKIRDHEGAEGWVHNSMLTSNRNVITLPLARVLYKYPEKDAVPVAFLEPGVVGKVIQCENQWCRVQMDGIKGWILRNHIWGVYKDEMVK